MFPSSTQVHHMSCFLFQSCVLKLRYHNEVCIVQSTIKTTSRARVAHVQMHAGLFHCYHIIRRCSVVWYVKTLLALCKICSIIVLFSRRTLGSCMIWRMMESIGQLIMYVHSHRSKISSTDLFLFLQRWDVWTESVSFISVLLLPRVRMRLLLLPFTEKCRISPCTNDLTWVQATPNTTVKRIDAFARKEARWALQTKLSNPR